MYSIARVVSQALIGTVAIAATLPLTTIGWGAPLKQPNRPNQRHNVIIFVADGLRFGSVTRETMPTLSELRQRGVNFVNSHSLFPTFTTANASAIATGHYLGDTGDFSNTINVGFSVKAAKNSTVPFLENDAVLAEVNQFYQGNYLNESSLLALARQAHMSTAAIGKIGPVLIQDIAQNRGEQTIVVDDATGSSNGVPLSNDVIERLQNNHLPLATPERGDNGKPGSSTQPGTKTANLAQQQYFADVATKIILPLFKQRQQPFVMVYWSRDPDGTQHNQGDSLNQLVPGINGPTSKAALQNVDNNLAQLRAALKALGLAASTDVFVTSDHGFSTISKQSKTSYAASLSYPDVPKGFLPPGFLAIDLAHTLNLAIFDPDKANGSVNPQQGQFSKNALIGKDAANPVLIVAGNGGSDLLYIPPQQQNPRAIARQTVTALLQQDYVSGIFVKDDLGNIPGTLPLSAIGLSGNARTPSPAIVVNFRSFNTGCQNPTTCAAEVADTALQQGQGMHGSFSRSDTYNTMAAIGPDFKAGFIDKTPVSNADLVPTLSRILGLKLPANGKLVGRVLEEAFNSGPASIAAKSIVVQSQPAANGLKTVLKYQVIGGTRYFDTAGFPGRTLGL